VTPVPRWVVPVTAALSAGAVAVSVYLTIAHFANPNLLVCASSGTVSCEAVTTSAQAAFLGIPVAVLGLLWSIGMLALCLPQAWRSGSRLVHLARLLMAVGGIGFVLWLVYAELFIIGAICLWCTVVHVIAFALFVIVVITAPEVLAPEE
jgi:uncharacterized membrane protein